MDPQKVNLILGIAWPVVAVIALLVGSRLAIRLQERYLLHKERPQAQRQREGAPQAVPGATPAGGSGDQLRPLDREELYRGHTKLVIHSENVTWTRFSIFLITNSILLVAWATLFRDRKNYPELLHVQIGICVFGALLGLLWMAFGVRARRYLAWHRKQAGILEGEGNLPRPFQDVKGVIGFTPLEDYLARSRILVPSVPFVFFVGYLLLLFWAMRVIPPSIFLVLLAVGVGLLIWELMKTTA